MPDSSKSFTPCGSKSSKKELHIARRRTPVVASRFVELFFSMQQAGSGEGKGETLMGEGGARSSDVQYRVSVVPFSGIALPVTKETYPLRAPVAIPYSNRPQTPHSNGPQTPTYSNGPPVSSKSQEGTDRRRRFKLPRKIVLGAKILFLALIVMAMFLPLFAKIHDGFLARAQARRVYSVRTLKHRTAFHFQPALNWMNDPTGLMYYQGYYHLFYQHNPEGAVWGNIVWGHAVSTDLVHWRQLEPALRGDQWYDAKGVWSGSATVFPDGSPVLMYTGLSETSTQMQCIAYPADRNDPLLRQWIKAPQNPVAVAPSGPTTAWRGRDRQWSLLVGSNNTALLHKSTDFQTWNFSKAFHTVPGTGIWESPDFYPVAETSTSGSTVSVSKHVLKMSSRDKRHDYYTVGNYVPENDTFLPATNVSFGLRYDYGNFFASKSFFDPSTKRRVLLGWVNESHSEEASVTKGWASLMSVPRQVWLDNRTSNALMQYPVEELALLRTLEVVSEVNVTVGAGLSMELEAVSGNQLDIEVSFPTPKPRQVFQKPELLAVEVGQQACSLSKKGYYKASTVMGPFGVYVLATEDLQERTAIYFHVVRSPEGLRVLVCNDQSQSSTASYVDTQAYGSFVRVYESDEVLSLRILVDHSIVETFVQGGRTVITSRVYPDHALDNDAHVFLFNNGSSSITISRIRVWNMDGVEITSFS